MTTLDASGRRASGRGDTELSGERALLKRIQKLVQHRVREWNLLRLWHPKPGQGSPIIGRVLGDLRANPSRCREPVRVLFVLELHAEKIK